MKSNLNIRQLPILLLGLIFLSACRLGKEYQRPDLALPEQFNTVSFSDTSSIADMKWETFFSDPILQKLIEKGLNYNHDLLVAVKRIDIAQLQLGQSKLLGLPEVTFQMTSQINRPSDNSLNGLSLDNFLGKSYLENYNTSLNVSWEADIWGKIRGQKEIALKEYLQTTEAAKAVQTQLVADIAQGFYNLRMLDKQLLISKKNLLLSDTFLTATRLLKDAGLGNELAIQQAESQRQSTAALIPQLEQSIALQENALQQLTGQLPGTIVRRTAVDDYPGIDDFSTGLPVAMVARRPDVRANELALMIVNTQVGIAKTNMYPALNITAGAGLESFRASNWFNIPNSLFGLAAGTIVQPVFKRKELKTQYEIAQVEREQAVIQFRQSVLNATREVVDALVKIDKLKEQEAIITTQVATLQQALTNAKLLFRSDLANYLEVIIAQGNALQAELNLSAVRRQQLGAGVELYRALGGGWK